MARSIAMTWLLLLCSACEPEELIGNPWVDRWCGDHPCGWETEGEVQRIGTWHENDYAAELVSDDAAISFLNETVDEEVRCFRFSMLARVQGASGSLGARAYLEMDFMDDGTVEYSERLPEGDFEPLEFAVTPPTYYRGVRFILRKDGPGEVIIARVRAREGTGCTDAPLDLNERPSGAPCEADDQCVIGDCSAGRCAECASDAQCEDGRVCGDEFDGVWLFAENRRGCVEPGREILGSPCSDGSECSSGVCCEGQCAECCPGQAQCSGDGTCASGEPAEGDWWFEDAEVESAHVYHRCDGGERLREAGESCALAADCVSTTCSPFVACSLDSCPDGGCGLSCDEVYVLESKCE
jgi:hypothetical protein